MFAQCADPKALEGLSWLMCYLTSGKHLLFYASFGTVLLLLAVTAPLALLFGFGGAMASRSRIAPLRWFGKIYTAMVRGVPDIIFFLFVPIALDQGIEFLRSRALCDNPVSPWQGNEFNVCAAAKMPLSTSPEWVHEGYGFTLAVVAFSVVFGAFAANVLYGAMNAVPRAQLETAEAYGMSQRQVNRRVLIPQMWTYALPGLSNLWMILIKATPLLFLLGIQDIVYWARDLGGAKTQAFSYPHPDWRLYYFLAILVFYLLMTWVSERVLARLTRRLSAGQATMGGEALRQAGPA
ncbi:MAG: ABC transporter permease [Paracoccus sp. (in: a-proteobacteria)]|uniref:ABC transporter permease n=1 Tax=unclassified Paracoccus (in: a-proteobacteria) TaxID=2688777 RepID=UPI000C578E3C|nr:MULTISPECIES: ABC transporter permease subunit [unclassified Paracoccus (in: a-proteobacteria)]MAN55612.1 ABC transporter permease [Paracoccus sp. (in: a-proteobacteria)]MBA48331.1 ABC transporter permease [Paracoccus sp. (in: a-proteobacteria)]MCS5602336.1 ABC transporter permease subunit [Paracoccus sp. (in: a-proteobacteria)]|tara:strand:- start:5556 stop:6437 length:882 start_codon:yes stop_codon:yes gene_type:complete